MSIEKVKTDLQKKIRLAQNAVPTREIARTALDCLDYTSLKGDETPEMIREFCDVALANRTASVCIYPDHVAIARKVMDKSGQGDRAPDVATVLNFPYGNKRTLSDDKATPETTFADAKRMLADGSNQIDIVMAYESFRDGDINYARELMLAASDAIQDDARFMVILETGTYHSVAKLREACRNAYTCRADFLKTSTGKHESGGATLPAAAVLLDFAEGAGRPLGVKLSGGVKTHKDAAEFIELARSIRGMNSARPDLFRIGASGVLDPLVYALAAKSPANPEY